MKRQQMAKKFREIFVFVAGAMLVACGGEAGPMDDERPEDVATTSQGLTIKGDFGHVVVDPRMGDLTIKGDLGNIVDPGILALIFQGDFGNIVAPGAFGLTIMGDFGHVHTPVDEPTRRNLLALLKCVRAQLDDGASLKAIRATCGSPHSATR